MVKGKFRYSLEFSLISLIFITASGCGSSNSSTTEDSSTSGTVASTVGGSYASAGGGSASSFLEPRSNKKFELAQLFPMFANFLNSAHAATTCPTIASGGSTCSVSSNTATLTYSSCSFSGSSATWNGSQIVAFTGATPVCGSTFPTSQSQVVRTFGSVTTRKASSGTSVAIDTSGAVTAANSQTYSGGITVTFSSGARTGMSISGIDLVASTFSHTLTTSSAIGGSALVISNGTITSGTVVTIHNLAKVYGSSAFNNVAFSSTCCTPTSGSITTTFSAISGVAPAKSGFVGSSETLTFTGCGTATYTGPEGYSGNVTLAHCF